MSEWDKSIGHLRDQLDELRLTLSQNDKLADSHRQSILAARSEIEQLLLQADNAREALYQLPVVFGAFTKNHLIGSLVMGKEGEVVLHNFAVQRFLPIDPVTGKLSSCVFFDSASGERLPETRLPWHHSLKGERIAPCTRLKMQHPHVEGEVYLEVATVPLCASEGTSGVILLLIDSTEPVRVDQHIRNLCKNLDDQVASIEAAHRELQLLASQMGVQPWADEEQSRPAAAPTADKQAAIPRVLLVDDIPVNQKLLFMQLRSLGMQIDQATNGMEAVMLCRKQQYSLVFMDCDMPILNGFEATEQIRRHEKTTGAHVPIVAMTSYDRADDREKCLASGMDDYFCKGVSKVRLQEIIDHYVFDRAARPQPTKLLEQASEEGLWTAWLNMDTLEDKFGDDARKIVALFFDSNATLLNCLEFAIQDKDVAGVHQFAHALKGPCSTLGLSFMVKLGAALTSNADAGNWSDAADKYRTLQAIFQQLKSQVGPLAEPMSALFPKAD
jgi:CheY-like chemotaxis protein/HPt (histidine-containing phosphotransfer) domain-containing protein